MRKDKQPEIPTDNGIPYKEIALQIAKIRRHKKSLLNIAICSFGLFLFWFLIGQACCISFFHETVLFSTEKGFLMSPSLPIVTYFALITTSLTLIALFALNKIHKHYSDFPLIKLFAKSSLKKSKSKSSKSMRRKS
ncbi:MAG: hypothetical protein K2W94_03265 [Alphaproteobacteria bacterium]|nr:hypothetical protein [Alphaproteobacteria bacterium]